MEKIIRDYGSLIKGAVYKASCGQPWGDDIVSEVYFAVLLTVAENRNGLDASQVLHFFLSSRNKVNDFLRQKYRELSAGSRR